MNILIIHPDFENLKGKETKQDNGLTFVRNISIKQNNLFGFIESFFWDITIINVPKSMLNKDHVLCLKEHANHIVYMIENKYWSAKI